MWAPDEKWSLRNEILVFLAHQRFGGRVTRFQIKDYVWGDRGVSCSESELEEAIGELEKIARYSFPDGSLEEDITSVSAETLRARISEFDLHGQDCLTKLDELQIHTSHN